MTSSNCLEAVNKNAVLQYSANIAKKGGTMKTVEVTSTKCCSVRDLLISNINSIDSLTTTFINEKNNREINIIGEWFLCFFNLSVIRENSFLAECNRCLKFLNDFICKDKPNDYKVSMQKRMKRIHIIFIIQVLKEMMPNNKEILFQRLDDLLIKAAHGDKYFNLVLKRNHGCEIVGAFYRFLSSEIDLYSSNRLQSIIIAVETNFEDNDKRCTFLDHHNELVINKWSVDNPYCGRSVFNFDYEKKRNGNGLDMIIHKRYCGTIIATCPSNRSDNYGQTIYEVEWSKSTKPIQYTEEEMKALLNVNSYILRVFPDGRAYLGRIVDHPSKSKKNRYYKVIYLQDNDHEDLSEDEVKEGLLLFENNKANLNLQDQKFSFPRNELIFRSQSDDSIEAEDGQDGLDCYLEDSDLNEDEEDVSEWTFDEQDDSAGDGQDNQKTKSKGQNKAINVVSSSVSPNNVKKYISSKQKTRSDEKRETEEPKNNNSEDIDRSSDNQGTRSDEKRETEESKNNNSEDIDRSSDNQGTRSDEKRETEESKNNNSEDIDRSSDNQGTRSDEKRETEESKNNNSEDIDRSSDNQDTRFEEKRETEESKNNKDKRNNIINVASSSVSKFSTPSEKINVDEEYRFFLPSSTRKRKITISIKMDEEELLNEF